MRVAVVGSGYVGLVTGACLAAAGHRVHMVDVDVERVAILNAGRVPFFEPGLEAVFAEAGVNLSASVDPATVVDCGVVFLAVPTPPAADGSCDTSILFSAARAVAPHLDERAVLVVKSTVPVGTTDALRELLGAKASGVRLAMNPEFLREGRAVGDFQDPHRVVVGTADPTVGPVMAELYDAFVDSERPLILTDVRTAELCKYAANAYLAMRVAWINEIAGLSRELGADIDQIREAIGSDPRIGPQYLQPGPGYGGTCFPKDVQALGHLARKNGLSLHLVDATHQANLAHRTRIVEQVLAGLDRSKGRRVALWGLAFKADTDDTRESIALQVLDALDALDDVEIAVWDPQVGPKELGARARTVGRFATSPLDAARDADIVVLLTEWPSLTDVSMSDLALAMAGTLMLDTRNLLDPAAVLAAGLEYWSVGLRRPRS